MKKIINSVLLLLFLLFIKCSSTTAINDFFGIKMNPRESDYFKIIAYTESSGISYQSSPNMDPNILAWARLEGNVLRVKLVNNSETPLELNYDSDQYIIVKNDNKEYICTKENIINYSNIPPITKNKSVELILELPQNYWETVGIKDWQTTNKIYMQDFGKGQNTLAFNKEEIKFILINIGFTTNILLKLVPKIEF